VAGDGRPRERGRPLGQSHGWLALHPLEAASPAAAAAASIELVIPPLFPISAPPFGHCRISNGTLRAAMEFLKMQGTGNDFVLVDGRDGRQADWPDLARRMSDRHFGVGADGLLLVRPSEVADYRMLMWNPDGSESEMCG